VPLRRPLSLLLALAASALSLGTVPTAASGSYAARAAASDPRPNIVLVTADDMAAGDLRWMPHTRRLLGGRGATFEDGIAPNPMCCPARATLLTGQESHNNGVWSNTSPNGGYAGLREGTRLPEWLQDAGYLTAFLGKHLNGFHAEEAVSEPGWTVLDALVKGVYSYRSFTTWNNGDPVAVRNGYVTDHLRDATTGVVRRFEAKDDLPFFVWVSHVGPHNARENRCDRACWTPPLPAARDEGDYAGLRAPTRDLPSFNRRNDATRPPFLQGLARKPVREIDRRHQRRVEALQSIDRSVKSTVRVLRDEGELARTVFVFTSDNGYLLGQYRYVGKRLVYEDALRVPLLVRGPGVPAGSVVRGTASTSDISSTIVDLAGAVPPGPLDGTSLVPSFTSGRTSRHASIVQTGASIQGEGDGEVGEEPSTRGWLYRGYRDDRWTYVRYPEPSGPSTPDFEELYDRTEDPFELHNLAGDADHAEVLQELRRRARALEDCVGQECVPAGGAVPAPGPTG
jgi:N-acetylglucosamine-6-sulfatase